MNNDGKRRVIWHRIVALLQCVVLLVTIYAMVLPALTMERVLACEQESHVHDSSCYEKVLTCTQEDGHVHTDACYTYESVLTCDIPEHTHSEECYDAEGNLVCEQQEHTHTDECYTNEQTLTCELPEGHVHTDACYKLELTCGKQEHAHSDNCYADRKADVEGASDWEDTLPEEEELNGEWPHDVVAVAESQLDYTESVANWQLSEDGQSRQGYTRYGAWFGAPYADWCAMFASFCLHYAGVPKEAIAYNASCPGWVEQLKEAEHFVSPDADYVPQPGDLLFLNFDPADQEEIDEEETGEVAAERTAQHVGIIKELDEEHKVLYAYEGNSNNKVQLMAYLLPGYVEPTEEEQQDLPEEERFHTPEISMQLHEKSIVGYGSLQLIKETFDEKYPNGVNSDEDETNNETPVDAVIDNEITDIDANGVVDVDVNAVADDAADNGVSAQSIPGNDEPYGCSRRVVMKAMLDGEWQTAGVINGYSYENGQAYITTAQAAELLAEYGYIDNNVAGNNFGYAMPNDLYYAIHPKASAAFTLDADLGDNGPSNGDNIHLWTFSGADNQIFKMREVGNGLYIFSLLQSIKNSPNDSNQWWNLNLNGNVAADRQNVQIWCDESEASKWSLKQYDDGTFSFRSGRNSNYAIDIPSGRCFAGVDINMWPGNDADAQKFVLQPTHVFNNEHNSGNHIYLGTDNGSDVICYYTPSGTTWNGTAEIYTGLSRETLQPIHIDPNNAAGANGVRFVANNGTCTISNLPAGYTWAAVNDDGQSHSVTTSGTTVTIANVTEKLYLYPSQITYFPPDSQSGIYKIDHTVTYKVHVNGEWKTVGVQPNYHYGNGINRAWVTPEEAYQFLGPYGYKTSDPSDFRFAFGWNETVYHIFWNSTIGGSEGRTNYVIDVPNGNSSTGTDTYPNLAQLWTFTGGKNQAFRLDDVGDGFVAIRHAYRWGSQGALNMKGGGNANDTKIQFYNVWENDTSSQWRLDNTDYGTVIYSRNGNNQAIDCDSGNASNGLKLHTWSFNGTYQYWDFVKTHLIYSWKPGTLYGYSDRIVLASTQTSDVICYYIPQYAEPSEAGSEYGRANGWTEMTPGWPDIDAANSIQVVDEEHRVYGEAQLASLERYVCNGGSTTLTLNTVNGYNWVAVGADGTAFTGTVDTANQTCTLNFNNVWQSYTVVLTTANPTYRVGYYGYVKKIDSITNGNANLGVFDTTGRVLPQNGNYGTDRLMYLQLNDDGSVKFKEERLQIYADQNFNYMASPALRNFNILHDSESYYLSHITVKTGSITTYDSDSTANIAFVSNPAMAGDRNGTKNILLTDNTYIELTYRQTRNESVKLKTRLLDYDFMSQDQTATSTGSDNHAINWSGNMELNGGAMPPNYAPQYLFGNINAGVLHGADYLTPGEDTGGTYTSNWGQTVKVYKAPGDLTNSNNWVHCEGGGGDEKAAYRINASSNSNWRLCFFGIAKDTLAWNSETNEYDFQFRDGIAHPKDLFNNKYRDGKHILNDYNLVFDRVGDSYTLRQVAGKGDDGYLRKADNINSNDMNDLRCLTNVGGYSYIFSNNFWPLDNPARWDWDGYKSSPNPTYRDKFYGNATNSEGSLTVNKIREAAPQAGQTNITLPASDDGVSAHNCLFGMNTEIDFTLDKNYVGPLDYLFFGDDDLWVYLISKDGTALPNGQNTQLICDIGGVHSAAGEFVNLRNYLPEGSSGNYALKIFYTERGNSGSTCYMNFTLPSVGVSTEERNTSVSLQKLVDGGDPNKNFSFTFNASDEGGNPLNGEYSYAKVVNGIIEDNTRTIHSGGTVSLKANESITIYGLPIGSNNTVTFTEANADGYISTPSIAGRNDYTVNGNSITFKLSEQGSQNVVTFLNTKLVSAKVTKQVAAGGETNKSFTFRAFTWAPNWGDHTGTFPFTIQNSQGERVTGGYLNNGWGEVGLLPGQSLVVEELPLGWHIGFYEVADPNYTASWTGTGGRFDEANEGNGWLNGYISDLTSASIEYACICTNTPNPTSASLQKLVANAPSWEENREYEFTFRYADLSGAWTEDNRDYPYQIYDAEGNAISGKSGILHYNTSFKLTASQKIVVRNILPGYRIEFIETAVNDILQVPAFSGSAFDRSNTSHSGWGRQFIANINANENNLICTNTFKTTSASLTKVVSGENIEPNKEFNFLVLIWNYAAFANGDWSGGWVSLDGSYPCTFTPSGNANRPQTVANGATFSLKAGETITISGLPVGARISFYEEGYDGYATSWSSTGTNKRADGPLDHTNNWKGWIQQLEADANNNKFTCTNAVNTASATLTKVVTGANPGPTTSFSFITRIWKDTPNDMDGKTYRYTVKKASGGEESGTLGDEGRFTLGAGDTITVTGIPVGATVGFYEQSYSGYDTTWAGGTSGNSDGWLGRYQKLTTANETIQFTCTNDSQYADLVVGKKVYGQAITDINWRNEPFTFQICDGTYGRNDQEIAHHPYIGAGVEFDVYTLQSGDSDTGIDGSDAVYVKTGTRKTTSGGMFMLKHNEKAVFHNVLPGKVRVVERIIHDINPFYVHMSGDGGVAVTNENFGTETFGFTADGEDYYVSDAFDIKPNGQYTAGTASETKVRNRAMDCGLVVRKTVKTVGGDTSANGIYALQVLINGQPLKGACWITGAVDPDTGADLPGGNNLVHTLTKEDGTTIEGVIYIRPGRDINIWNLNNGASFQITEIDAGKAGYLPTYEVDGTAQTGSATGTVKLDPSVENSNRTSLVHITNAEQGCSVEIPVKKTISNPNGKESTYSFTAFCWSNGGSNVSTGLSNKQTITISTDNSANGNFTFGYLSKNFPEAKEYTLQYRIDELAGTEANMFYETGIHWDVTVYVTKNADGTISARVADTHKLNIDGADQGYVADSHLGQGGKYYDNVEFINTWCGNINLTKKLHDANGNEDTTSDKTFSFNAYFEKADGTRLTERERNCAQITLNGQSVTMNDQGEFTFALSHGQTVSMTMLPVGTKCIVTENESAYKVEVSTDNGGTFTEAKSLTAIVPANGTVNAIFKNSPTTNSASLTKKVSGQGADKGKEFEFQPVIWLGGEGEHQWDNQSGNYTYTLRSKNADGSYQYYKVTDEAGNYEQINTSDPQSIRLQFDYANGKCTSQIIKLKDNWTFTIYGLPDGVRVGFYEKATAGYAASWDCTTQTGYRPDNVQTFIGYGVLFDIAENRNNDGNINHVTCTNTTGTELPQTGGVGQGLFFGIGALLMCCAGYLLLRRKRRDVTA